ncbi:flagellar biosynthesis protein FlgH [Syntrophotalea acetylenivorans]|uniref:Flagellar L-ring protein n=1 Tax=Syntrophotalea acetylenivorans TaxID=1842532 RepID=A0A1L3GN59_9BACT|nr:flagellar basal body L-ring protein FlgH [Syntrophotalea acetylenivorans]APG27341.1 flagellar biosynthesis protein FlgH [Syntrophotalea acetylenivorans]
MNNRLLSLIFGALLLSGCAARAPFPTTELPSDNAPEITVETPQTSGSLWTENKGSLFGDIKARQIGDILTVAIFEQASASREATTETGRSSSSEAGISKFLGFETDFSKINSAIDPTSLIATNYDNDFKGSGSTSRKENLVATLSTRVVEVFPNGNLRIEGGKTVTVNHEEQIIVLTGIVRPNDISSQNVIDSKYVLDAKIAYTGKGVISDKQRPGWMTRILDNVWPF